MQNDELTSTEPTSDADLILRSRSGDTAAFGELWRRHYPSGIVVARSVTSSIDADDLVQEAYTRIYQAVLKGGGPNGSFRAYLFTSIRNTAAAWGRARRETAIDELETVPDPDTTDQATTEALDRGLSAQAFRSLPTRWQEVLWYTEIEQMKPAEVAPLLGMKAGAVSQLAFRAREGLRENWIQAHLRNAGEGSECQWTIEHLGAHARGNLSTRDGKRVDDHLESCARCMIVAAEAKDVSSRLALVLLPLVLGVSGAAAYTASLQSGGAPIVALAAMPSSVVAGAVVAGEAGEVGGAAGIAVFAEGNGAGGAAGSSGGGASGGSLGGIGALVGVGSAALVVAGVVAAAVILPGFTEASPLSSMSSAAQASDTEISTEVVPDPGIESDQSLVIELPDEAPNTPDAPDSPEQTIPVPPADSSPETLPELPVAPQPSAPAPAPSPAPMPPPVDDEEPTEETPGEENPGGGENTDDGDPETVDPEPSPAPGEDDDDNTGGDDGQEDEQTPAPGGDDQDPEPAPALPTGIPSWQPATQKCLDGSIIPVTQYSVPVSGTPNATVKAVVTGLLKTSSKETRLDSEGKGVLDLKPTADQILFASRTKVEFFYTFEGQQGEVERTTLNLIYSGEICTSPDASTD